MKLLYVDCCISQRGTHSRTAQLCRAFLTGAQAGGTVQTEHLDLKNQTLAPFTAAMLDARDARFAARSWDDPLYALARQFRDAEGILVGAPFWDLSFPAQLRIYLEHISANGITYFYDETGPHGSCKAQWLVYLTSGGDFEHADSLGVAYWRQLCGMYGIPRFHSLFAGGLDADPAQAAAILAQTCEKAAVLGRSLVPGR